MESVADCHEHERSVNTDLFGALRHPADVPDAEPRRAVDGESDHLRFLIDRPDLVELVAQRERDLAGTAGQIEQTATATERRAVDQVANQRGWIRQPEAVVERRGA